MRGPAAGSRPAAAPGRNAGLKRLRSVRASVSTPTAALSRLRPDRESLLIWGAILYAEAMVVLAYVAFVGDPPSTLRYVLLLTYPFVWIDLSLWAYWRVDPPGAPRRRRAVVGAVAGGYLLVLSYFGGVVGPGAGEVATGLRIVTYQIPPGFAPAALYSGSTLSVNLIPFKVVGYLALAYLLYVTLLDAVGSAAAGVLGLFSCVSCTFPLIAGLASGLAGGSAALATTITEQSYGISTAVFVVTVLLLVWRPTAADLGRLWTAVRRE